MDKGNTKGTNGVLTCVNEDIPLNPSLTKPVGRGKKRGRKKEKEREEEVEREALPSL